MSPAQGNSDNIVRLYKRWPFKQICDDWTLRFAMVGLEVVLQYYSSRFRQHYPVIWPLLCSNQPPLQHDPSASSYLQLAAVTKTTPEWNEMMTSFWKAALVPYGAPPWLCFYFSVLLPFRNLAPTLGVFILDEIHFQSVRPWAVLIETNVASLRVCVSVCVCDPLRQVLCVKSRWKASHSGSWLPVPLQLHHRLMVMLKGLLSL